jgi:dolichyl-phosphate beta-glucosyltransferase
MKISIVIPAFNEADNIFDNVKLVLDYCRNNFSQSEIILVNDGSDDGTLEIMNKLAQKHNEIVVIDNIVRKGKGYSLRKAMLRATGSYICFTDADLSAPIWQLNELIFRIEKGFDIAIGSRALQGSNIEAHQPWYRENMGRAFNLLVRLVTSLEFRDTQCGFKVLRKEAVEKAVPMARLDGFCFDAELLYIAKKIGLKTCEIPVIWRHSPGTKVRLFFDSVGMLSELFKIKYNDWTGKYEK